MITMPLEMETLWELIANSVVMQAKSLYISHAVSNFYGTGIEIWAGFGPVGNTEKKSFEGGFFMFHGEKN